MHVIYTNEAPPHSFEKSLFLAGPTPRDKSVLSWRPKALDTLREKGYDGVVFVPEDREGATRASYEAQVDWEHKCLHMADCILFWVPRNLRTLPGFTTNIEYGLFAHLGKSILGAPRNASKMEYFREIAERFHIPQAETLEEVIDLAIGMIGAGALRSGGEREIPLNIWRLRAFQGWHGAQKSAGNRLDGARIEWISRVRNNPGAIFAFALRPNIYVASEDRNKFNDPVIFRLDISTVILFKPAGSLLDAKIVLVREFRPSCSNDECFVWELPGGSSAYITDPLEVAVEEVREEVGLNVDKRRLELYGVRQLVSTLSTYKAYLYGTEITDEELGWLYKQKGIPHGDFLENPTGERAYTEICTVREILDKNLVDWSNVGMILSVLNGKI